VPVVKSDVDRLRQASPDLLSEDGYVVRKVGQHLLATPPLMPLNKLVLLSGLFFF
jgi:hypothetical protein